MPWQNWKEEGCRSDEVPGLDCIQMGHILVEVRQKGAWETWDEGDTPWASWCLWCGSGTSNEKIEE